MSFTTKHAEIAPNVWIKLNLTRPVTTWVSPDWDSNQSKVTARLPASLTRKQINHLRRSLGREMSTHCKHSYDCCGHWYGRAVALVSGRRLTIKFYNYQNI